MKRLKHTGFFLSLVFLAACATGPRASQQTEAWPMAWQDRDGDCQRTRTEVLLRDLEGLVQWGGPMSCEVVGGEWHSRGRRVALDIDNVRVVPLVPVDNAIASGAGDWSREKKLDFMNDMENLIILDPVSEKERNGFGPDRWIPLKKYWCEYARRWEQVKSRYGLSMSEEERGAVAHMKTTCGQAPDASEGAEGVE